MSRACDSVPYRPQARSHERIDNVLLIAADMVDNANAVTHLRALAGDVRALLRDPTLLDDDIADLRTAEQALERAAARHEDTP